MSFMLFVAYYSCTHLQTVNNRMNYFSGLIILFHKKAHCLLQMPESSDNKHLLCCFITGTWLTGEQQISSYCSNQAVSANLQHRKNTPTYRKENTLSLRHSKRASPHKGLILYWRNCSFRVSVCHSPTPNCLFYCQSRACLCQHEACGKKCSLGPAWCE